MNEQELINQLKQADQAAGMPPLTQIQVDSLDKRTRQRQRIHWSLSAAAALILAVGWLTLQIQSYETTKMSPVTPAMPAAEQLAAFQATTRQLQGLMDRVEQERQLQQRQRQVDAQVSVITQPVREALAQADLVAEDMVADARRLMQQRRRRDAIQRYQRVIKLFPQSPWARVADQRLNEIQTKKKSTQLKGENPWQGKDSPC